MNGYFYIEEGQYINRVHILNKSKEEFTMQLCKGEFMLGYCYCLQDMGYIELTKEEVKEL